MQQVISSNVCCWLILVALDIINKLFYQLVYYLRLVCVGMEWYKTFVPYNKDIRKCWYYVISVGICFFIFLKLADNGKFLYICGRNH